MSPTSSQIRRGNECSFRFDDDSLRLYRPGDPAHPSAERKDGAPSQSELPVKYHQLLDWYEREYCNEKHRTETSQNRDPVLQMWGLGKEIWQGVDADEYVRSLCEDWDTHDDKGASRSGVTDGPRFLGHQSFIYLLEQPALGSASKCASYALRMLERTTTWRPVRLQWVRF